MRDVSDTFLQQMEKLSGQCPDTEEAMRRNMTQTQKLLHAQYVNDLFKRLIMKKVSNAETEELGKRICKTIKKRTRTLIGIITRWKYEDSFNELRNEKRNQTKVWRECEPIIRRANILDEYNQIWITEKGRLKEVYKRKLEKKVKHLVEKYGRKRVIPDEVEGIIIKDQPIVEEFESNPRCYGNVEISEEERQVLKLPPKFSLYERIDVEKTIAEIEKGMVKLRYEKNFEQTTNNGDNRSQPPPVGPIYKQEDNTFDFRNMRATDMPNNKKVYLPPITNSTEEMRMQILKRELTSVTEEYSKENKTNWDNLR